MAVLTFLLAVKGYKSQMTDTMTTLQKNLELQITLW
jgi:hypothetical protein